MIAESERLYLRKMTSDDYDFLFRIFNDSLNMKYYPSLRTSEETKSWIEYGLNSYEKNGYGKWIIVLKESDTPIGHCGILNTEVDGVIETELGYFLHNEYWGKGFAQEASKLAIQVAQENYGLKRIISAIDPKNTPSLKVAQRLGMRMEKNATAKAGEFTWNADIFVL